MSKALEYIKSVVQIALNFVVLVIFSIIVWNFPDLKLATQKTLERASVGSINLFGVDINLDQDGVNWALFRYEYLKDSDIEKVRRLTHGLTAKEFERLMYVGQYDHQLPPDLCEYKNPTPEMRDYVAADKKLDEQRLTDITYSPAILSRAKDRQAKAGKSWDIGDPIKCYELTLTDDGYNVKTALVKNLSVAFGQGRPSQ